MPTLTRLPASEILAERYIKGKPQNDNFDIRQYMSSMPGTVLESSSGKSKAYIKKLQRNLENYLLLNGKGMEEIEDPFGSGYFTLEGFIEYLFTTFLLQEDENAEAGSRQETSRKYWQMPHGKEGQKSFKLCIDVLAAGASSLVRLEHIWKNPQLRAGLFRFCYGKEKGETFPRLYLCVKEELESLAVRLSVTGRHAEEAERRKTASRDYNIFYSLPDSSDDRQMFLCLLWLFTSVIQDACMYCKSIKSDGSISKNEDSAVSKEKEMQMLRERCKQQEEEINLLEDKLTKLGKEKEDREKQKQKLLVPFQKEISGLEAELSRQEKRYRKLEEKNRELSEERQELLLYVEDLKKEPEQEKEEICEDCDHTLRYAFFCDDIHPQMKAKILESFPNSRFVHNPEVLEEGKFDMVILLTKYCKHPVYYAAKAACANRHIPYIHFAKVNTEKLSRQIAAGCRYREG